MTAPAPIPLAPAPPLRVVPPGEGIDVAEAERAAGHFLAALGVDIAPPNEPIHGAVRGPGMTRRIAGVPVWSPSDLIGVARAAISWTDETVGVVMALPKRVAGLLGDIEALVARVGAVVDRADHAITRVEAATTETAGLIGQAAPLARRFVEEFSADEFRAAIRLVDQLPALAKYMETDIMPILATVDRVGPNLHDLLDVLKDVRQAIIGIPGLRYLQRRGEREEAAQRNRGPVRGSDTPVRITSSGESAGSV